MRADALSVGDECWGYSKEEHPEMWTGALPSREEAIAEALVELDSDVFYIHHGRRPHPQQFFPDASDLLEVAAERSYDEAGEAAEDWPAVAEEALAELDAAIDAWAEKHLTPCRFWLSEGKGERIERATHRVSTPEKP